MLFAFNLVYGSDASRDDIFICILQYGFLMCRSDPAPLHPYLCLWCIWQERQSVLSHQSTLGKILKILLIIVKRNVTHILYICFITMHFILKEETKFSFCKLKLFLKLLKQQMGEKEKYSRPVNSLDTPSHLMIFIISFSWLFALQILTESIKTKWMCGNM